MAVALKLIEGKVMHSEDYPAMDNAIKNESIKGEELALAIVDERSDWYFWGKFYNSIIHPLKEPIHDGKRLYINKNFTGTKN